MTMTMVMTTHTQELMGHHYHRLTAMVTNQMVTNQVVTNQYHLHHLMVMVTAGNSRHRLTAVEVTPRHHLLMPLAMRNASPRMTLPGLISLALQPQSYLQMERQMVINEPMSRLGRGTY